jgi:hypothetical protein
MKEIELILILHAIDAVYSFKLVPVFQRNLLFLRSGYKNKAVLSGVTS